MARRGAKSVYRRPLQELHEENQGELPAVLKDSIEMIRRRGLHTKGLFRGCAECRKVQLLVRAWDQGHNPLKIAKIQDCQAVAESLLQWLRALPSPIIPCRHFRAFLHTQNASCQAERLSELHLLFQQLEDCEFQALLQLLGLLHDYVLAQTPENFSCPTLGQTFGPLILRGNEGPLPLPFPEDVRAAADLVDFMINDYSIVFSLQSPSSSPYHKPPSRARKTGGLKRELGRGKSCRTSQPGLLKCGAAGAAETWPSKHLRVNVVPPIQENEVDCLSPVHSGSPIETCMLQDSVVPNSATGSGDHLRNELRSNLATVPEGKPLSTPIPGTQEADLDDLVGKLLCGSMESMLFENNDELFLARTSSLMSISSANTLKYQSSCGDSTDMSSDEEPLHDSACCTPDQTPPRPSRVGYLTDRSDFDNWHPLQPI